MYKIQRSGSHPKDHPATINMQPVSSTKQTNKQYEEEQLEPQIPTNFRPDPWQFLCHRLHVLVASAR